MKYRKKPVVIEAFRFQIDKAMPDWFNEKRITNEIVTHDDGTVEIKTLEGMMKANKGDYIIQGVNGEIYPCKPDIFEKTYGEVVEMTPKEHEAQKMYKIGDKVEYLNNVWEVYDCEIDSVEIYNDKMSINIYVPIGDVMPYRTAHEKLIEMGYEHHEYSYGDVYELKESYKYNGLSGRIQTDNQGAINCGDVYIGLELSRILTQYLEEMK